MTEILLKKDAKLQFIYPSIDISIAWFDVYNPKIDQYYSKSDVSWMDKIELYIIFNSITVLLTKVIILGWKWKAVYNIGTPFTTCDCMPPGEFESITVVH